MDQLSKDAIEAAKHGISYGKYMAMKEAKAPAVRFPKGKQHVERFCKWCGEPIPEGASKNRLYCNGNCGSAYREAEAKRRSQTADSDGLPHGRLLKIKTEYHF